VAAYGPEERDLIPGRGNGVFSYPPSPDRLWEPRTGIFSSPPSPDRLWEPRTGGFLLSTLTGRLWEPEAGGFLCSTLSGPPLGARGRGISVLHSLRTASGNAYAIDIPWLPSSQVKWSLLYTYIYFTFIFDDVSCT
jgi:hypothetical protein